jgi:hypothetical protein
VEKASEWARLNKLSLVADLLAINQEAILVGIATSLTRRLVVRRKLSLQLYKTLVFAHPLARGTSCVFELPCIIEDMLSFSRFPRISVVCT